MSFDTIEILSIYTADGTELFITDDEANDEPTSVILKDPTEYAHDTKLKAVESYAEAWSEIASEAELSDGFDDMVGEVSERHHNHLDDGPAMAEWFNNWAGSLTKDGELHPVQYHEYTYVGSNAALRNHGVKMITNEEYKEIYKLTGYCEVERNIVNCLHIRNMHTACHELWICEDDATLPVLAKSLEEGIVPFDIGVDTSLSVDHRTQREDGTFITNGTTYQPTNKEVLDVY